MLPGSIGRDALVVCSNRPLQRSFVVLHGYGDWFHLLLHPRILFFVFSSAAVQEDVQVGLDRVCQWLEKILRSRGLAPPWRNFNFSSPNLGGELVAILAQEESHTPYPTVATSPGSRSPSAHPGPPCSNGPSSPLFLFLPVVEHVRADTGCSLSI